MYKIEIDLEIRIDGCPSSGLAAIEFRETHGIPPEPTNKLRVSLRQEGEDRFARFCRAHSKLLDNNADLRIMSRGRNSEVSPEILSYDPDQWMDSLDRYTISPQIAAAISRDSLVALPDLLDSLLTQARESREQIQRERAQEKQSKLTKEREIADRVERIRQVMEQHKLECYYCVSEINVRPGDVRVDWTDDSCSLRKSTGGYDLYDTAEDLLSAIEQREQEIKVYRAWVTDHGSDRLKRCIAEGIDCVSCYRDERLTKERPGWRWERDVPGESSDPRNPPDEAFTLLDQARQTLPHGASSRLVYWTDKESDHRGYAVISEFLGREIVFGGPESED